jgi:hypothetical protein
MAALAHGRSSIAVGSASPRIEKLIAACNSLGLVPNASSTIGTDTPAFSAITRSGVAA